MSVSSRVAARVLPLFRPGLSRRGVDAAVQRYRGTSILLSQRTLGQIHQHHAPHGLAARRGWGAGGLRWYSSTYGSLSDETDSSMSAGGESLASSAASSIEGVPQFAFAFE